MASSTSWTAESADWYASNFGEYATNRLAIDKLLQDSIIPTTATTNVLTVVDVGCGTGSALRHLATKWNWKDNEMSGSGPRLIGLEPTPRMLEIAKERAKTYPGGEKLELLPEGADQIPLQAEAADVVLAFDVLDHVPDLASALQEIYRVLKPNGYLAIVKDGGIGDDKTVQKSLETATSIGFAIQDNQSLQEGDVTMMMAVLCKQL